MLGAIALAAQIFAQELVPTGTTETLNDIHTRSNLKLAWAVGNAGTILHTKDQGITWTAQNAGTSENLNAVDFINDSTGVVVGENGFMAKTIDSGKTWSVLPVVRKFHKNVRGITSTKNGTELWICTGWSGSEIYKSTDGGMNWEFVSNSGRGLGDIVAFNDSTIAAITTGAFNGSNFGYRTEDFGQTWSNKSWTRRNFDHIDVVSPTTAWAVHRSSKFIERSTNTGNSFSTRFIAAGNYTVSAKFGTDSIMVAGTNAKNFVSPDNGVTWVKSNTNLTFNTIQVQPNSTNTALAGSGGTIYITRDGGVNWTRYYDPPEGGCNGGSIRDIQWVTDTSFYALFHTTSCNGSGNYAIFRFDTLSKPNSFQRVNRRFNGSDPREISIAGPDHVWMFTIDSTGDQRGYTRSTMATDTGSTYKNFAGPRSKKITASEAFPYDTNLVIIAYEDGMVMISKNASTMNPTWDTLSTVSNSSGTIREIIYDADKGAVWMIGDQFAFRSTDASNDWAAWDEIDVAGSDLTLNFITVSGDQAIVVGNNNLLYISNDAYASSPVWTKVDPTSIDPTGGEPLDVAGVSGNVAYASGKAGMVVKTTNGGGAWSAVSIPAASAEDLTAAEAKGVDSVWVGANNGSIYYTYDGGSSWTKSTGTSTNEIMEIVFSGYNGWAVSKGGEVLYSTNAGVTWNQASTPVTSSLRRIELTPTAAYVVGDAGVLLKSTDGGVTWDFVTYTGGINDVALTYGNSEDAKAVNVYLAPEMGGVAKSVDGSSLFRMFNVNTGVPKVAKTISLEVNDNGTGSSTNDRVWALIENKAGNNQILRTRPSTTSDSHLSVSTPALPNGLSVRDRNNVYIACDSAKLLVLTNADRNRDNELTRNVIDSIPGVAFGESFKSVRFRSATMGVVGLMDNKSLTTKDGGASWQLDSSAIAGTNSIVLVKDTSASIAVGTNGLLIYKLPVVISVNDIEEFDSGVSLYPNPASTTVSVNGDVLSGVLYNAQGVAVSKMEGNQINVEGLSTGTYILRLVTESGVVTKSLAVK